METRNQYRRNNEERPKESEEEPRRGLTNTQIVLRAVFGVLMIIVYVGMGVLLLINYFGWSGGWAWTRYIVGIALILYGIYRAWRQYKGIDSPI